MRLIKINILLLFAITIYSCTEKKYEWSASISVPKEYPVAIQRGLIGKSFFGPSCVSSSWGTGIEVARQQAFTVPDTFEITWLSLVEQKFYTGKWILPKNKIQEYFKNGFSNQNKRVNCNKVQIGLAPKGVVVVWLLGDKGIQIEIGRYQADQIILDSKDVSDNAKFMFDRDFINNKVADLKFVMPEIKENIKIHGYPLPIVYDLYREKYIWEPKFIMPEGARISSIIIKMCNGESEIRANNRFFGTGQKSIPYLFRIAWKDKKGQEFISRIALTKSKDDGQKYFRDGKEELPLNFDKNLILTKFEENIKKNLSAEIVIRIENESVSDFYLEQQDKIYSITEFSQSNEKVLKNNPCICK